MEVLEIVDVNFFDFSGVEIHIAFWLDPRMLQTVVHRSALSKRKKRRINDVNRRIFCWILRLALQTEATEADSYSAKYIHVDTSLKL